MNQVNQVSVRIFEEDQAISGIRIRLAFKRHTLRAQPFMRSVEIIHRDRNVSHAWRAHAGFGAPAFGRDDFDHRPICRLDKVVARVFERDFEIQISYVPIGEPLGIR